MRLAEKAEAQDDLAQAIGAWRAIAPYIYAKPKSVEIDPDATVKLAKELAEVRNIAPETTDTRPWGERVDKFVAEQEREKEELALLRERCTCDFGGNGLGVEGSS